MGLHVASCICTQKVVGGWIICGGGGAALTKSGQTLWGERPTAPLPIPTPLSNSVSALWPFD